MQIFPKSNLTFSKCLEMGLQNHIEAISKVAEVAGKEFSIEQVNEINLYLDSIKFSRNFL